MNAEFCEARTIWALVSHEIQKVLDGISLSDLVGRDWIKRARERYPDNEFLDLKKLVGPSIDGSQPGCPAEIN